jgi:hypothetical protein
VVHDFPGHEKRAFPVLGNRAAFMASSLCLLLARLPGCPHFAPTLSPPPTRFSSTAFDSSYAFLRRAELDLHGRQKDDPDLLQVWIVQEFRAIPPISSRRV